MDCVTYDLPKIEFIGGNTETILLNLWHIGPNDLPHRGTAFNATGCTVTFSVIDFTNKNGQPLLSKAGSLIQDDNGVLSRVTVTLDSADTLNISGKYIYQVTIKNSDGTPEIPGQGIIHIHQNIDKNAASGTVENRIRI